MKAVTSHLLWLAFLVYAEERGKLKDERFNNRDIYEGAEVNELRASAQATSLKYKTLLVCRSH